MPQSSPFLSQFPPSEVLGFQDNTVEADSAHPAPGPGDGWNICVQMPLCLALIIPELLWRLCCEGINE